MTLRRLAVLLTGLVAVACASSPTGEKLRTIDPNSSEGLVPVKGVKAPAKTEVATFACGCFWGVEQEFRKEPGVVATAVGYSGGHVKNPNYEMVCTDKTGHAETVRVSFDPSRTSYAKLLKLFWELHDPTLPNQAGPDFGTQYRSVIFYHTPSQKAEAIRSRDALQKSGELNGKIVTEIVPAAPLTLAEKYHQQYVEKGGIAFCHRRKGG